MNQRLTTDLNQSSRPNAKNKSQSDFLCTVPMTAKTNLQKKQIENKNNLKNISVPIQIMLELKAKLRDVHNYANTWTTSKENTGFPQLAKDQGNFKQIFEIVRECLNIHDQN